MNMNPKAEQIVHYENVLFCVEFMFKVMFFFQELTSFYGFRTVVKCSFTVGEV